MKKKKLTTSPFIHDSLFMIHYSRKGFTLIELMVAVAVIAVVSSFVFASVGKKQQDATRAAQKLALDIRTAQNTSLAPTDEPVCVYGIKLTSATTYVLYVNKIDCPLHDYVTYGGISTDVRSETLESGVSFSSFGHDIAFEAPEPITYINGATGASPLTITLQGQGGQHSVVINRFGRIEIQ